MNRDHGPGKEHCLYPPAGSVVVLTLRTKRMKAGHSLAVCRWQLARRFCWQSV